MLEETSDKTLVDDLAQALHAQSYLTPGADKVWDHSPTEFKEMYRKGARTLLAKLSKTHLIVPLSQPGQERDAAKDLEMWQAATGGTWREGIPADAVVTDAEVEPTDPECRAHYGGGVICESAQAADRRFIIGAHEMVPYWIKRCIAERDLVKRLQEHLEHIQGYWNGSRTDGAMSNALEEILHTVEVALGEEVKS
jgi:hypothetical protein